MPESGHIDTADTGPTASTAASDGHHGTTTLVARAAFSACARSR
jgi:hypothetical protein